MTLRLFAITGGLVYGGLMDVSLHPQFKSNSMVYISFIGESFVMAVARFVFKDRTIRDFEVIFESNAFSIGSRIAWQNDD
jgi:glucose/arabinose dehydrogenase